MLVVSPEYRAAMDAPVRDKGYAEAWVSDIEGVINSVTSSTDQAAWSNLPALSLNKDPRQNVGYATWMTKGFRGDGVQQIIPSNGDYEFKGFASLGPDAILQVNVSPTSAGGKITKINRLTLYFDVVSGVCPKDLWVDVWAAENQRYGGRFTAGSPVSIIPLNIQTEEVYPGEGPVAIWSLNLYGFSMPEEGQNVVITGITLGVDLMFGSEEITRVEISESISPLNTELPKSSIKISLKNENGQYDPRFLSSVASANFDGVPTKTRFGIETENGPEWVFGGSWYHKSWAAKGLESTITAESINEWLTDGAFEKSPLERESRPAYRLDAVIEDSGFSGGEILNTLDSARRNESFLPLTTHGGCIQLIAAATSALTRFSRYPSGEYGNAPLTILEYGLEWDWAPLDFHLTDAQIFTSSYGNRKEAITECHVTWTDIGVTAAASTTLFSQSIVGDQIVRIEHGPLSAASTVTSSVTSGVTIKKDDYLLVTYVTLSGLNGRTTTLTVAGRMWPEIERSESRILSASGKLLGVSNPYGVDNMAYTIFANKNVEEIIETRGHPEIETGDIIYFGDEKKYGMITARKFTFNGAFRDTFTVIRGDDDVGTT